MMFCSKCGKEIDDSAIICPECGCATGNYQQQTEQPKIVINNNNENTNKNVNIGGIGMASPKNKIVALVLCFFLGMFGAHRFYVGKFGTGLLWLCTFGLFGMGVIVDFIVILLGKFTDKYGRPLL